MGEGRRRAVKRAVLPVMLGVAALLILLSRLHPASAYPLAYEATITPTCFVYLPCVAKEATPAPTPIPGVDLLVWDIVVDPPVPTVGQTFVITVTAKNRGGDDAPMGTYIWLDVGGFHFEELKAPLAAGATADMVRTMSFSHAGSYIARGEVDPDNFVLETDEGNNVLQQPFEVAPSE